MGVRAYLEIDGLGYKSPYKGYGGFRKSGLPHLGALIIRILLFRVLYWGHLFSETPL